ncbi:MAG: hypothetical protein J5830_01470, partial [Clostridia bacterium]|nr:hypothetical protein [Clostridia bacterium]
LVFIKTPFSDNNILAHLGRMCQDKAIGARPASVFEAASVYKTEKKAKTGQLLTSFFESCHK